MRNAQPETLTLDRVATPVGEVMRYRLRGDGQTTTELRTLQDWVVERGLRQVPGVADVVAMGGFIKQYEVQPDLEKLFTNPPMLLKVDLGEATSWKKARAINSVADFFQVVKDVRNNLFHGDIRPHSDREERLIKAAQQVLDLAWSHASRKADNPKLVEFCEAFRFKA